jgi:two-component system response regulator AtoC
VPRLDEQFGAEAPTAATRQRGDGGLTLRLVADEFSATHPLPSTGQLLIGRAEDAEIRVEQASISRRHARLHLENGTVAIEDLGSANGTTVRGRRLAAGERVAITPGEPIDVGSVLVVVQAGGSVARSPRLATHGYFEERVDEECRRADRGRSPFSVARLQVAGLEPAAVEEALHEALGDSSLIAAYAPGEYEILCLDGEPAAQRMMAELEARGAEARLGLASHPGDGRSAGELLANASQRLRGGDVAEGTVIADENMRNLYRLAERIAQGSITVLILGETGVGKEVFAETIHRRSPRAALPFVRLNCAALPESLLESELFGYERGAFSGAAQAKPGLIELAHTGTLFLDEVGELPLALQAKLLRVLEERTLMRLGGLKERRVDVRFVAATNRDLEAEADAGRFRRDLYFRLNGFQLLVPPLRERLTELEALAELFVGQAARQLGRPAPRLGAEVLARLRAYSWPGNLRELRNMMERAVLLAAGPSLEVEHLPVEKMASAAPASRPRDDDRWLAEEEADRQRIIDALAQHAGNQTQAARALGISRTTLVMRLEAYRLPRPRKRRGGQP